MSQLAEHAVQLLDRVFPQLFVHQAILNPTIYIVKVGLELALPSFSMIRSEF